MPEAVWKKRRRLMPRRLAIRAPISFTRASNSRCLAVWGPGMNSSLDTDCTGIGEGKRDSAEDRRSISSGLSQLMEISFGRRFEFVDLVLQQTYCEPRAKSSSRRGIQKKTIVAVDSRAFHPEAACAGI